MLLSKLFFYHCAILGPWLYKILLNLLTESIFDLSHVVDPLYFCVLRSSSDFNLFISISYPKLPFVYICLILSHSTLKMTSMSFTIEQSLSPFSACIRCFIVSSLSMVNLSKCFTRQEYYFS